MSAAEQVVVLSLRLLEPRRGHRPRAGSVERARPNLAEWPDGSFCLHAGNSIRKPVTSNLDHVEAKAWRNVVSNRFSRSAAGDYTSPVLTWYTDRPAKVAVQVQCTEATPFNFYGVTWIGHPDWGFDNATFDFTGYSTSGSSYIYPDQRTGYIEIATQDGCTGTVTVSQVVRTHVKV